MGNYLLAIKIATNPSPIANRVIISNRMRKLN
jgi:hypothetical protein